MVVFTRGEDFSLWRRRPRIQTLSWCDDAVAAGFGGTMEDGMDAEVVVEHAACGDGGCELVTDNVNWGLDGRTMMRMRMWMRMRKILKVNGNRWNNCLDGCEFRVHHGRLPANPW